MSYKYGVVIPTMGIIEEFSHNFENIIQTLQDDTHVVLVINAYDGVSIERTKRIVHLIFEKESTMIGFENIQLTVLEFDSPIGYARACNEGYRALKRNGLTDYVYFVNDDVTFFDNRWMVELVESINSERYNLPVYKYELHPIDYHKDEYGLKTGMSSAVTDQASGMNIIDNFFMHKNNRRLSLFQKKMMLLQANPLPIQAIRTAGIVSCLCKEMCLDVEIDGAIFDEKTFNVGGYEDDDLCVRIEEKGWTSSVSVKTVVSHVGSRSLNKFDSQFKGFANAIHYYKKYEHITQKNKTVGGLYRVKLNTVQDVLYFKSSIHRTSQLTDKLCMVLTDSLFTILQSWDFQHQGNKLSYLETDLFRLSSDTENYEDAIKSWIASFTEYKKEDMYIHIWKEDMQERDERNKVIELARLAECDWGFSVDHDEVIEERITKEHIQKLCTNPNPLIKGYLVTWSNHWESPNLVRKDKPIDDGGDLTCGMTGVRLFQIDNRNIVGGGYKGLHCGPSPTMSVLNYKHANITMRHFGMLRNVDRQIKQNYYRSTDKNINASIAGSTDYSHINKNEMIPVSQYTNKTGVGLTMMCYDGEKEAYLYIWMDRAYPIVDEYVLTWTSEWEETDKEWMYLPVDKWRNKENWYKTGPSWGLAHTSVLFNVQFTHKLFSRELGFAETRNHGIDLLREKTQNNPYLRWGMFFDPDEMCEDEIHFARAITACSKDLNRHGFIVKFNNPLIREKGQEAEYTLSESTRIFRVDMPMRMNGRIHESFNDFFADMYSRGIQPKLTYFPYTLLNVSTPEVEDMQLKLDKYVDILTIQLQNNPLDSGSWVSLGLQAYNDGDIEKGVICYERGVLCAGEKYLAFEQMALHHLRVAKDFMLHTISRLPRTHAKVVNLTEILEKIEQYVPKGRAVDTEKINFELPDFPYDKVNNNFGVLITDREKDGNIQDGS